MTDPIFLDWYMKGPTFSDIPVYALTFHSKIFEAACSLGIQWIDCNICLTIYGSNMVFHALTFGRSRGRCWKPRPEAAVFNTSLETWRMLMHWKTMFDRYHCIKTENVCYISRYFLHYFVSPFHGLCSFWGRAVHISWRQQFCGPGTSILKVP